MRAIRQDLDGVPHLSAHSLINALSHTCSSDCANSDGLSRCPGLGDSADLTRPRGADPFKLVFARHPVSGTTCSEFEGMCPEAGVCALHHLPREASIDRSTACNERVQVGRKGWTHEDTIRAPGRTRPEGRGRGPSLRLEDAGAVTSPEVRGAPCVGFALKGEVRGPEPSGRGQPGAVTSSEGRWCARLDSNQRPSA